MEANYFTILYWVVHYFTFPPSMSSPTLVISCFSNRHLARSRTRLSDFTLLTFMHWRMHGNPLQCSCLENRRDGGARWAAISGVAQSWTGLSNFTTERLHFHFSLWCIGEGNGNPLQCSCLENRRDRGVWWAAVSGVAQSWTRLKRLSSSSSRAMRLVLTSGILSLLSS